MIFDQVSISAPEEDRFSLGSFHNSGPCFVLASAESLFLLSYVMTLGAEFYDACERWIGSRAIGRYYSRILPRETMENHEQFDQDNRSPRS